jgi:hypothetical protein
LLLLGGDVENGIARHLSNGTVHQNVETAELGRGVRHQLAAEGLVANVSRQRDGFAAGR